MEVSTTKQQLSKKLENPSETRNPTNSIDTDPQKVSSSYFHHPHQTVIHLTMFDSSVHKQFWTLNISLQTIIHLHNKLITPNP